MFLRQNGSKALRDGGRRRGGLDRAAMWLLDFLNLQGGVNRQLGKPNT